MHPRWIAPIVTWLASTESGRDRTRVRSFGDALGVAESWHRGPNSDSPPASPAEVGAVLLPLLDSAAKPTSMLGICARAPRRVWPRAA